MNYAKDFKITDGINEEYLSDCKAAIEYIKSQGNSSGITLLGHSLGGQIASELAANDKDVTRIILLNSSARNLSEIACDQYCLADPANEKSYIEYREAAMAATEDTAKGLYYYGATDYYWITLNKLDTIQNIKDANIPTLIINSTNDKQVFNTDIQMWKDGLLDLSNVSIVVDDTISHFIYEIVVTDNNNFYRRIDLPDKIINLITDFIE
ncbi:MAG: alpha/beta hydrolase [Eubacteriales bacterium]